jgi:hypothetical protein
LILAGSLGEYGGFPEGEDINISLLEHVSPIEWENIILYGQYVLNTDDIR